MSTEPAMAEPQPVALASAREEPGALVFDIGLREIRIAGDVDWLREAVTLCDGAHTAGQIAEHLGDDDAEDVRALLDALLEQGVVEDFRYAWRRFHLLSSVQSGLMPPVASPERAAAQQRAAAERFAPRSAPTRREAAPPGGAQVRELGRRRGSMRVGRADGPLDFDALGNLLAAMYGQLPGDTAPVPSAGAHYPMALHVLVRRELGPLEPGLWWYDQRAAELGLLAPGLVLPDGAFLSHPTSDPVLERAPAIVFLSADIERVSLKYGNRAYRFGLIETGAVMQNAVLAGVELGVGIRPIAGFVDEDVRGLLDLPPGTLPLLALLVGG